MKTIETFITSIINSNRLSEREKFIAIEDLEFMIESKLYADRVMLNTKVSDEQDLSDLFNWSESILGREFWTYIFIKVI